MKIVKTNWIHFLIGYPLALGIGFFLLWLLKCLFD